MIKKIKLTKFSDAGHGWLKVPRLLINKLGIQNEISCYSYQKGAYVYLEEDGDTSIFIKSYIKNMLNQDEIKKEYIDALMIIEYKFTNRQSQIRNYASYNPNKAELSQGLKFNLYGKHYVCTDVEKMQVFMADNSFNRILSGPYKLRKSQLDYIVAVNLDNMAIASRE